MAKFAVLFTDEDSGDIKVVGLAESKAEAISLRAKTAMSVIEEAGLEEEDEETANSVISSSKDSYAEWNGLVFQVIPVVC